MNAHGGPDELSLRMAALLLWGETPCSRLMELRRKLEILADAAKRPLAEKRMILCLGSTAGQTFRAGDSRTS